MNISSKKCAVCGKESNNLIEKHEQVFCGQECLNKFEEQLKELEGMSLDDCC
ncbi:MAG TPA: hypothetical protein VMX18_00555 [Candidatus Bipolaricaulota bacterium]|nr:hypothetical protein [Candidatus Bipolaricaulota bacterium]